jgi:hypothetical protein
MPREIITAIIIADETTTPLNTVSEDELAEDVNMDGDLEDLVSTLEEGENEGNTEGGFSISFTSEKEYDLDEIIKSISRDNDEYGLNIRVNQESVITLMVYYEIKKEILDEYSASSEEEVLGYDIIFKQKLSNFDDYLAVVSAIEFAYYVNSETTRNWLDSIGATYEIQDGHIKHTLSEEDRFGQLLLNEKQPKVEVKREDMKRYLFDEIKPSERIKPVVDYTKTLTEWTDLGEGDTTTEEDLIED